MTIAAPDGKLPIVEYLRGIAALGVVWFHMTHAHPVGAVQMWGYVGGLGVEIFFVISGFVLPLSLWRRFGDAYSPRHFADFAKRRIIRIEPVYILSMLFTAFLVTVERSGSGLVDVSLPQMLAHLAYLPKFFGYEWIQPVYWSLVYEFCFYAIIGSTFWWLIRYPIRTLTLVTLAVFGFKFLLFDHLDRFILLFPLGGVLFLRYAGLITSERMLGIAALLCAVVALLDWQSACAGAAAAAAIHLFVTKRARGAVHKVLIFFGTISYSLYITHIPMGGRAFYFGSRLVEGEFGRLIVSLSAVAFSIAFAWLFYRCVERPFVLLSKGKRATASAGSAGTADSDPLTVFPRPAPGSAARLLEIDKRSEVIGTATQVASPCN